MSTLFPGVRGGGGNTCQYKGGDTKGGGMYSQPQGEGGVGKKVNMSET